MEIPTWYLHTATVVFWIGMAAALLLLIRVWLQERAKAQQAQELTAVQAARGIDWGNLVFTGIAVLITVIWLFVTVLLASALWPIGVPWMIRSNWKELHS